MTFCTIAVVRFRSPRPHVEPIVFGAHSVFSAILAGVISPLIAGSALTLAFGMGVLALAGSLCWCAYLWRQGVVPGRRRGSA